MKHILITNDDGYESIGLRVLMECLEPLAHITVVAPAMQKSACGHSLTLTKPLKMIQVDKNFYKVIDGTPSDCIFLALHSLFKDKKKPDLVVSGINLGSNMGEDITYSGTASAAMEAVLHGVNAIALSQVCKNNCSEIQNEDDFRLAVNVSAEIVHRILSDGFPLGPRKFLNINIPPIQKNALQGIKVTQAGHRIYGSDLHCNKTPRGEQYFWIGLHPLAWKSSNEIISDFDAIADGYVSVTPIMLDMTSIEDLNLIQEWI